MDLRKTINWMVVFMFSLVLFISLLFELHEKLSAGTCDCQCFRQASSCGSSTSSPSFDCIFTTVSETACLTGTCAGAPYTFARKFGCAYTF